jgi:hypothetical protein
MARCGRRGRAGADNVTLVLLRAAKVTNPVPLKGFVTLAQRPGSKVTVSARRRTQARAGPSGRARPPSGRTNRRAANAQPPSRHADSRAGADRPAATRTAAGPRPRLTRGHDTFLKECESTAWRAAHAFVSLIFLSRSVSFLSVYLYLPVPLHLPGPLVSLTVITDFLTL